MIKKIMEKKKSSTRSNLLPVLPRSWSGRCIWGVSHDGVAAHNCRPPPPGGATERRTLVVSGADADAARLEGAYRLRRSAGAGYKALCVVDGVADAYVLTHASTYKWDTCAPHAVLRAAGGGATGCDAAARSRGKSGEKRRHSLSQDGGILRFKVKQKA